MKIMAATNQESRLHGLKFFLFDVSVVVCIAAALLSAFRDVDLLSKTRNGSPSCAQPTPASNAPVPEPTPPETSAAGESRNTAAFPAGTLVEDRGRPAVVRAIEEDRAGDVVYSVTGLADSHITRTSSVRPYRAHETGTAALCHVKRDLDAEPVPCTVMSTKGSGFGLGYEVHWATEADERHVVLPMSRVLLRAELPTLPPPAVAGTFLVGSVVELKGSSFPSVVTGVRGGRPGRGRQRHLLPHQRHLGRGHAGSRRVLHPALPHLRRRDRGALQRRATAAGADGAVHRSLPRGQRPRHDLQGRRAADDEGRPRARDDAVHDEGAAGISVGDSSGRPGMRRACLLCTTCSNK